MTMFFFLKDVEGDAQNLKGKVKRRESAASTKRRTWQKKKKKKREEAKETKEMSEKE
jgi:hypothetical protein